MDIAELRKEIDRIDHELLNLLQARLGVALEINRAKHRLRLPLRDETREGLVIEGARQAASGDLTPDEAEAFITSVLEFSRGAVGRRMASHEVEATRICIIGLGLIGGSIARALTRANPEHTITGVDVPFRLGGPRESGLFEEVFAPEQGAHATAGAKVIFLCAAPSRNLALLPLIRGDADPDAVITDVGGLKQEICATGRGVTATPGAAFIGGHPIAGKAVPGFANSSETLFEHRPWVLTPDARTAPHHLRTLQRVIESMGASTQVITPEEHDRIMPAISHLPQMCAVALTLAIGGRDHGIVGPALRDMTRLAESSPELWDELLSTARTEAIGEVQRLRAYLSDIEMALGLNESIASLFERAAERRREMMRASVTGHDSGE